MLIRLFKCDGDHKIQGMVGPLGVVIVQPLAHQLAHLGLGSLEPGMAADLIAVAADPLAGTTALKNVSFVINSGQIIK